MRATVSLMIHYMEAHEELCKELSISWTPPYGVRSNADPSVIITCVRLNSECQLPLVIQRDDSPCFAARILFKSLHNPHQVKSIDCWRRILAHDNSP